MRMDTTSIDSHNTTMGEARKKKTKEREKKNQQPATKTKTNKKAQQAKQARSKQTNRHANKQMNTQKTNKQTHERTNGENSRAGENSNCPKEGHTQAHRGGGGGLARGQLAPTSLLRAAWLVGRGSCLAALPRIAPFEPPDYKKNKSLSFR